jgi:hypothetical protein
MKRIGHSLRIRTVRGTRWALLALVAAASVVALVPIPASAQGAPCTPTPNGASGGAGCTITVKAVTFDLGPSDQFGCPSLPSGEVLATVNAIFHVNINRAGDNWTTSTLTGPFTIVSGSNVLATGHLETWFAQENNLTNSVGNAVLNLTGTNLQTGQGLSIHFEEHAFFDPITGQILPTGSHFNTSCG